MSYNVENPFTFWGIEPPKRKFFETSQQFSTRYDELYKIYHNSMINKVYIVEEQKKEVRKIIPYLEFLRWYCCSSSKIITEAYSLLDMNFSTSYENFVKEFADFQDKFKSLFDKKDSLKLEFLDRYVSITLSHIPKNRKFIFIIAGYGRLSESNYLSLSQAYKSGKSAFVSSNNKSVLMLARKSWKEDLKLFILNFPEIESYYLRSEY